MSNGSAIPDWFPAALANAMAQDSYNSLTTLERSQVDHVLAETGYVPAWFRLQLEAKGLIVPFPE